ncbi:allantoate amidohydrolase [soil metagenome]
MRINAERIFCDIEAIASFSEVPASIGYSRPTFTPAWAAARDYVIAEAKKIGCRVWIDAAGNVHARPAAIPDSQKVWLSGSHIDSVPTGGKFDGVLGIVAPLEVLRVHPNAPLELIIFAEEEGSTFNLGMLGSRAWAGTLSADQLAKLKNKAGVDPVTAGKPYGLDPVRLADDRLDSSRYLGLIEIHAEQGLSMWKNNVPVAVVTAINGRKQYSITLTGEPNHAGSTKMADRTDALACAAEIMVDLEDLGRSLDAESDHTVITVGQLSVAPNAINVIPSRVIFTIDFRARTGAVLEKGDARIKNIINEAAGRREIAANVVITESLPAEPMNAELIERLRRAAKLIGVDPLPVAASGALHDSAILAPLMPTVMIFVASKDGISHNPAEFSRIEDIATATEILAAAVMEAT